MQDRQEHNRKMRWKRKRDSIAKNMLTVCYQQYNRYAETHGYDPDWRTGIAIEARDCAEALLKVLEAE